MSPSVSAPVSLLFILAAAHAYTTTSGGPYLAPANATSRCAAAVAAQVKAKADLAAHSKSLASTCLESADFACDGTTPGDASCGLKAGRIAQPLAYANTRIQKLCVDRVCGTRGTAAQFEIPELVRRRSGGGSSSSTFVAAANKAAAGGCEEGCRSFVLAGKPEYYPIDDYEVRSRRRRRRRGWRRAVCFACWLWGLRTARLCKVLSLSISLLA